MRKCVNAAIGAHSLVFEDGPEVPKVSGPHAEQGGETLEGMYADGCSSPRDSRIVERAGYSTGSPFPSDNEDEDRTSDQARLIRGFRKGRRPEAV
jgi:hypothetical protein